MVMNTHRHYQNRSSGGMSEGGSERRGVEFIFEMQKEKKEQGCGRGYPHHLLQSKHLRERSGKKTEIIFNEDFF